VLKKNQVFWNIIPFPGQLLLLIQYFHSYPTYLKAIFFICERYITLWLQGTWLGNMAGKNLWMYTCMQTCTFSKCLLLWSVLHLWTHKFAHTGSSQLTCFWLIQDRINTFLKIGLIPVAYPGIFFVGMGVQQIQLRTQGRENGDLEVAAPYSGVPLNLQMNEPRILIRLLRMYFPRNREFGSALSKLWNFGKGWVWTPHTLPPQYTTSLFFTLA
jgi:hypothetical protein